MSGQVIRIQELATFDHGKLTANTNVTNPLAEHIVRSRTSTFRRRAKPSRSASVMLLVIALTAGCSGGSPLISDVPDPLIGDLPLRTDQPQDSTQLVGTLGPVITQFERIPGCPYPDPERNILRFRVNPAPDGARTRRVAIHYEYQSRYPSLSIFNSPASESAGVQTAGSIADPEAAVSTNAYVLRATDIRGRTSTRRLDYRYLNPEPRLDFVGAARPPREIRVDGQATYEYALAFVIDDLSITAINLPTAFNLVRRGRSTSVPVERVQLWEVPREGEPRPMRLPHGRIDDLTSVELRFRTPVSEYRLYENTWHDSWSLTVALAIRHPNDCRDERRQMQVVTRVPPLRATPPPSAPESEEEDDAFTGYLSEVACVCDDTYDRWGIRVQACMINERGARWVCQRAESQYEFRATTCAWQGAFERLESEPSCYAVLPAPRIVETIVE